MTEPPFSPNDADLRVCAVCARGLHRFVDTHTGETNYVHPFDMALTETDDHPPVPVMPNEITADTRCDFCFWRDPQWVVPANSFEYESWHKIGMPIRGQSVGSWAACDTCADLVNRGLWSNLLRRAQAAYVYTTREMELESSMSGADAEAYAETHVRTLFRQLRKNITGSPRHLNG